MPCDPQVLVRESVCIQCGIPSGMQSAVLISLLCQIRDNGGTGGGNAPDLVIDNIVLLAATTPYNAAHGLGAVPSLVTMVFKCIIPVGPYVVGDEIDHTSVFDDTSLTDRYSYGANATNVWIYSNQIINNWGGPNSISNNGGTLNILGTEFVAKLRLWI